MTLNSARAAYLLLLVAVVGTVGALAYIRYVEVPRANPNNPAPGGPPVDPVTGRPKGRLVVLVVFDQMKGVYLDQWAGSFGPGGFERMKRDGVWYADAQIPYACTSTGPGHASLVTGAVPAAHGIVENEWLERTPSGITRVYCCQPGKVYALVPPPPKGADASRGAETGFSPERLLAETVGDKLKAATGGTGRVVSLSVKDRTAVLMGGKKPDAAYCFDTRDGLFHTGEFYRDRPHPWVAEFNAGKPADRWFGRPWTRFRENLDYEAATRHPDAAAGEDRGVGQGLIFPHPTDGGLKAAGPKFYEAVETSPFGNDLLLDLAKKAVAAEKLGQGATADLLCLSFSSNDLIGHRWGPDSWEVFDVTLRSDALVADLLGFLDAAVGKDRYTLVVSADHGVCTLPEAGRNPYPAARRVLMTDKKNEVFGPLAAKLDDVFGPSPTGPTRWFETADAKEQERVWPWVYLNHSAVTARGLAVEQVAEVVRERLVGLGYFEAAFTRKDLADRFPPGSVGEKIQKAYRPDRCGDVIAVPKPGVLVTRYENGTGHGSPHPYDAHVPVLAVGAGVPALGKKSITVSSLVVAPILAKALGIDPPAQAAEKPPF